MRKIETITDLEYGDQTDVCRNMGKLRDRIRTLKQVLIENNIDRWEKF